MSLFAWVMGCCLSSGHGPQVLQKQGKVTMDSSPGVAHSQWGFKVGAGEEAAPPETQSYQPGMQLSVEEPEGGCHEGYECDMDRHGC